MHADKPLGNQHGLQRVALCVKDDRMRPAVAVVRPRSRDGDWIGVRLREPVPQPFRELRRAPIGRGRRPGWPLDPGELQETAAIEPKRRSVHDIGDLDGFPRQRGTRLHRREPVVRAGRHARPKEDHRQQSRGGARDAARSHRRTKQTHVARTHAAQKIACLLQSQECASGGIEQAPIS